MTTAVEFEVMLENNNVEEIIINQDKETVTIYLVGKEDHTKESQVCLNIRMRWVIEWLNSN